MRAKEFEIKKRDPNWKTMQDIRRSGAGGQHKDKKKAEKQGDVKHKGKDVAEGKKETDADWHYKNIVNTKGLSDKAKKDTTDIYNKLKKDKKQGVAEGSHTTEKQILTRIRQIMYDRKLSGTDSNAGELLRLKQKLKDIRNKQDVSEGYGTKEFEVGGYTYITDIDEEEDNRKIWHMLKTPEGKTIDVDFTPYEYMSKEDVELYVKLGMPKRQSVGPLDREQLHKMAQIKGVAMLDPKMARAGMKQEASKDYGYDSFGNSLRPGSDEGNTEPPNNFAIYINGKKWKVFQGRGQYADDQYEMQQFRQLQAMAARKSQETGKKWEVYRTGEPATK